MHVDRPAADPAVLALQLSAEIVQFVGVAEADAAQAEEVAGEVVEDAVDNAAAADAVEVAVHAECAAVAGAADVAQAVVEVAAVAVVLLGLHWVAMSPPSEIGSCPYHSVQ